MSKRNVKHLIAILENNGYQYYIAGMVIHYGKEKYDKRMGCDYIHIVGGEIDYAKGFLKIVNKITN